jgi:hypothetical protein
MTARESIYSFVSSFAALETGTAVTQTNDSKIISSQSNELIFWGCQKVLAVDAVHSKPLSNVQLGKFGRNRTNVWQYPGVNTLSRQGEEGNLLALHPTVKPVALVAEALLARWADPRFFLRSGSTLIA